MKSSEFIGNHNVKEIMGTFFWWFQELCKSPGKCSEANWLHKENLFAVQGWWEKKNLFGNPYFNTHCFKLCI